jgi:hypothetical protein
MGLTSGVWLGGLAGAPDAVGGAVDAASEAMGVLAPLGLLHAAANRAIAITAIAAERRARRCSGEGMARRGCARVANLANAGAR